MNLNYLFEKYLEDIELTHQSTTIDSIKYRYNANIGPKFGEMELSQITSETIKEFQKDLISGKIRKTKTEKFSISYINIIVSLFKRLMKYAYLMEYIKADYRYLKNLNLIVDAVDKEAYIDKQIIWKLPEFNQFIDKVDDEKYKVLFNILFFCGLRKGEILALRWKNVDLINNTITINSTASKVIGKGQIIKSPKTKNSYRTIFLNDSLKEMLLKYYLEKRKLYKNISNMFVIGDTKMISFSALDRHFAKYKKASGVSNMNLHGFRHSHATLLLSLTSDLYTVSKRLGHKSIEITEMYLHSSDSTQKKLVKVLEQEVQNTRKNEHLSDFINDIEKKILIELDNPVYSREEINKIVGVYDFLKKIKN